MPGNSIGLLFRVTTFGESHGPLVGAVIDGCPAGLPILLDFIRDELRLRRPGSSSLVTPRSEPDEPVIVSGVYNGRSTGAPIAILIHNRDVRSEHYEEIKSKPRPGHADLAWIHRYGRENWDYRGGGRMSGRETAARVAAGAIAKLLLFTRGVVIASHLVQIGKVRIDKHVSLEDALRARRTDVRVADPELAERAAEEVREAASQGDSVGGVVEVIVGNAPLGLGDPVFDKLKADLAKALMSIPGAVGFEVGAGFRLAGMRGSAARDPIVLDEHGHPVSRCEMSGGFLGGMSCGHELRFRVAFKPTSSIRVPGQTVDLDSGEPTTVFVKGRHDPCIALRAAIVAEAMTAIVLADHVLRAGLVSPVRVSEEEAERAVDEAKRYMALGG